MVAFNAIAKSTIVAADDPITKIFFGRPHPTRCASLAGIGRAAAAGCFTWLSDVFDGAVSLHFGMSWLRPFGCFQHPLGNNFFVIAVSKGCQTIGCQAATGDIPTILQGQLLWLMQRRLPANQAIIKAAAQNERFNTMTSKHIKALPLLLVLLALLGSLPGTASQAQAASAWVDPAVTAYLEDHAEAPVLVVLRDRADLDAVTNRTQNWDARGREVLKTLAVTAAESQESLKTFLIGRGITFSAYWIVNTLSLKADADLVQMLAEREDVARVVLNAPFPVDLGQTLPAPPNPVARIIQPNLEQINAPDLWSLGYTGTGIRIGIADTGVKWDHPALKSSYAGWDGSSADHAYHWWDAVHDDSIGGGTNPCGINLTAPCDDYGHGTHVTGIITGDDGLDHQIGAAPDAAWIACRNMDSGYGTPETYIECYQFFLAPTDLDGLNPDPNQRPHIINNSFSCLVSEGCTAYDELHTAVEALRSAGIFMAVSAGNSGPACSTVNAPPALEPSVYTIGAVYGSDLITGFSSRGPVTIDGSGRLKPDLVAPGASILSSTYNDGYGYKSGTSMAGPHVAGGVAILWSAIPDLVRDIDATEALLNTSAHPLSCGDNCCAPSSAGDIPNTVYGYGRLDLLSAYAAYWGYQNFLTLVLSP